MTLRQEAHTLLDTIQDDEGIRLIIGIIERFQHSSRYKETNPVKKDISKKQLALKEMEILRQTSPFSVDIDYDKEREEAIREKYGSVN